MQGRRLFVSLKNLLVLQGQTQPRQRFFERDLLKPRETRRYQEDYFVHVGQGVDDSHSDALVGDVLDVSSIDKVQAVFFTNHKRGLFSAHAVQGVTFRCSEASWAAEPVTSSIALADEEAVRTIKSGAVDAEPKEPADNLFLG